MAKRRIEYEQLIAYAAGTLTAGEAKVVADHVAGDPEAAATVARYRLAHSVIRADDSVEPPASALARAKAIFRKPAITDKEGSWLERAEKFIARIVFDSRVQPATVRSADPSGRMNLTYEAGDAEIDLESQRIVDSAGAERWQLMGQVSPTDPSAEMRVALAAHGTRAAVTQTIADERGVFTLEADPGQYDLFVESPAGLVVIPELEFA